jgi:molecular chaperone GrpE
MESGVNEDVKDEVKNDPRDSSEEIPVEEVASEEGAPVEPGDAEKAQGDEAADEEKDPVAELEAELARYKEESLRRAAEMENYRKRMAKELAESRKFANQRLLQELLPVLDNFAMGMQMAEKEQGSMLYQGMSMVQGQLADFFKSQGVSALSLEAGDDFDPNFHEAVSQEETDEVPEGKVLHMVRCGYLIGERLLRPANVVVAKPVTENSEADENGREEQA